MMEVDPRLQISDLTDFPYSSLQYDQYANQDILARSGYLEKSQNDRPRPVHDRMMHNANESRYLEDRQQRYGQDEMYDGASATESPGFRVAKSKPNGSRTASKSTGPVKDPTNFVAPHQSAPMQPNPPNLKEWREKFFNIEEPLLLTENEYLTYFPHVDNVYSHRSTQKYKRKPFVSHYWDCRLKGRPTGTPMNKRKGDDDDNPAKKKRKRKVRERDLCDVKIKVTEFFGRDELEALRKLGLGSETNEIALNHVSQQTTATSFGILEPLQEYPDDHPGSNGRKWYMVQRVSGDKDEEEIDLNHKHTLEESDRIKKNSVQRWLATQEKQKKKAATQQMSDEMETSTDTSSTPPSRFHASGIALQTLFSHTTETSNQLTFYGSSFCPFAQRVWIALEHVGIPYQYHEITEHDYFKDPDGPPDAPWKFRIEELKDIHPEGRLPCLKHGNFIVWESQVMMEYLEDLALGQSLFPAVGIAHFKAHSRMWVDYINRRILPVFYALLILPDSPASQLAAGPECDASIALGQGNAHAQSVASKLTNEQYPLRDQSSQSILPFGMIDETSTTSSRLLATLHANITTLVNASHRTGPYFLGETLSYVDIAFAPWIVRLSRVLSYYRAFPRPEVGTRWQAWCDAVENDDVVNRTVSEEKSYREVYAGAAYRAAENGCFTTAWEYDERGRIRNDVAKAKRNNFAEMDAARRMVDAESFDWGGDGWGKFV